MSGFRPDRSHMDMTAAGTSVRWNLGYVISAVAALCASAFFVYFPITNTDIWWHLAAGREMLSSKSILHIDPFAYTVERPDWIDIHWGFQLIVYWLRSTVGFGGIVLIKCVLITIVGALLLFVSRGKRRGGP